MFFSSWWHRLFFVFFCFLLLAGCVSCENAPGVAAGSGTVAPPTQTPAKAQHTPVSTASTTADADCPSAGQGRAANMPGITLGNRQEIVTYHNAEGTATIQEFDVQNKTSSPIVSMAGETIQSAQLSQDGQWVLFVAETSGVWALQLVRVDGQDVQTLYCAPASLQLVAQWSPNQRQIIFSQGSTDKTQLFLLNPASGALQLEYANTEGGGLEPITWLDNSHVYVAMVNGGPLYQPDDLFVLDTSKGANQSQSDLKMLMGIGDDQWSFDCSLDGKTAYFTSSKEPPRADALQSVIYAQPALSGNFTNSIFVSTTLFVTVVRVINATTLMIVSDDPENPQSSTNGLYTVRTNGSGLKQLVSTPAEPSSWTRPATSGQLDKDLYSSSQQPSWIFNSFSQYTWSNFSRNGEYYVDGFSYGSFNGGPLTAYGGQLWEDMLVGWTTK
jgi:hypothetical protein